MRATAIAAPKISFDTFAMTGFSAMLSTQRRLDYLPQIPSHFGLSPPGNSLMHCMGRAGSRPISRSCRSFNVAVREGVASNNVSSAGEPAVANFFALFWGWADYESKDWSKAAYKRAHASSVEMAKFFASLWGWADYTPKDWSNAPYKPEHSARRASSIRYRSA